MNIIKQQIIDLKRQIKILLLICYSIKLFPFPFFFFFNILSFVLEKNWIR